MKLTLIEKKVEAEATKSFFWKPEKPVTYLAGQYFFFTLSKLNYPDQRGNTRHFTLSSSPTEGEIIRNTTRIRPDSGFKKTLNELPIGSEIEGNGPHGNFILDKEEKKQNIFLAGGIGITPFRSIIKYVTDNKLSTPIHLIYSNTIPEQITFREELEEINAKYENIKVSMTISKPEESKEVWQGLRGRIDEKILNSLLPNYLEPNFWICGPPLMVEATNQILLNMSIPESKIRIEKFTGY